MALAAQGFADRRPAGRVDRRHLRKRVRPRRRHPDRLGQRARAQPGAAAVRPPRPAPPHAAPRCPRRRRAVRVLGPHGGDRAERPAPPVPLADGVRPRVGRRRAASSSAARATSTRCSSASATAGRSPPATSSSASVRRARGGAGTTASWPSSTCSTTGAWRAIRRRSDFARLYDLPERVLPAAALAAPTPTEAEARKELLVLAARSLGVATLEDLTDYHRQKNAAVQAARRRARRGGRPAARPASRAGRKPAYVHRDATVPRAVHGAGAAQPVRLAGLEPRPHRAPVRLPLPHRDLRPAAEADLRLLRAAVPARRPSSSAASTSRPIGPPACCACRAPTPSRASTRPRSPASSPRSCGSMAAWLGARRRRGDRSRRSGAGAAARGPGAGWTSKRPPEAGTAWIRSARVHRTGSWPALTPLVSRSPTTVAGHDGADAATRWSRRTTSSPSIRAERRLPRWVVPAVVVFWSGFLGALAVRFVWGKLSGLFVLVAISVFLSLAIEPGVNRLARRGWRRGIGHGADPVRRPGRVPRVRRRHRHARRLADRRPAVELRARTSPTPSTRSTTRSAPTSTPRR